MTYEQYLGRVGINRKEHPNWRDGQCYFNTLREVRPDLANRVRESEIDPYFSNAKTEKLLEWLEEHWKDEE